MVDGKCNDESDMEMLLAWPGYRLTMSFAKVRFPRSLKSEKFNLKLPGTWRRVLVHIQHWISGEHWSSPATWNPNNERYTTLFIHLYCSYCERKFTEKTLRLYNTSVLLRTTVGRSYFCDDEVDIDLRPGPNYRNNPNIKDIYGTLLLRALQVQAFMYRSENFSTPFHCKAQRSFR